MHSGTFLNHRAHQSLLGGSRRPAVRVCVSPVAGTARCGCVGTGAGLGLPALTEVAVFAEAVSTCVVRSWGSAAEL